MTAPLISVIMPSYLGKLPNSARDRENKFIRAINSVAKQMYQSWELIIISDGCHITKQIIIDYIGYSQKLQDKIRGYIMPKCAIWSGKPRNTGIEYAKGELITYLDTDDIYEDWHLQKIAENYTGHIDCLIFDDKIWNGKEFVGRKVNLRYGFCGTSNIAHKQLDVRWKEQNHYGDDDWSFIKTLKNNRTLIHIGQGGYCVCHVPDRYDI